MLIFLVNLEGTLPEVIRPIISFDFSPCKIFISDGIVSCDLVSIEEIRRIFRQSSIHYLNEVKLILQSNIDISIPEDLIGNTKTRVLRVGYPSGSVLNSSVNVRVNRYAFRSTKSHTQKLYLSEIDCSNLNLSFLQGFDNLRVLIFSNIFNIQHCFPTLPPLFSLKNLDFNQCSGMNRFHSFPNLITGLETARFRPYDELEVWNDRIMSQFMDWLLISSAQTLENLIIENNKYMNEIPYQMPSFIALKKLSLKNNAISIIESGALSFIAPVVDMYLSDNAIAEIEPGAFQGKGLTPLYIIILLCTPFSHITMFQYTVAITYFWGFLVAYIETL